MHCFRSAARRILELYRDEIVIGRIRGIADGIMPDQLVSEPDADVRTRACPWQRTSCFRLKPKGFDSVSLVPDLSDSNRQPVPPANAWGTRVRLPEKAGASEEHKPCEDGSRNLLQGHAMQSSGGE